MDEISCIFIEIQKIIMYHESIDSVILSDGKTTTAGYTETAVDIIILYYAGGSLYFLY